MARTRIKFCGITRPEDAIAAARMGADAIGLIFYPQSSRFISVEKARDILGVLPPMVTPVGLFVNSSVAEIRDTARALNLHTVQLHGDETPGMVPELQGLCIIKAIRCDRQTVSAAIERWSIAGVAGILLETAGTDQPGGSGIENNWTAMQTIHSSKPLIAAGGLTPENVSQVVRLLHPWAVDVSTGIESSRGIKSVEKMQRFADAVHAADRVDCNGDGK